MVRIEQAVGLGLALTVGGGIATLTLVPMVKGTSESAIPYIPAGGWLAVIGGTILLGMAGTLLPILRTLQTPIEAIGRHKRPPPSTPPKPKPTGQDPDIITTSDRWRY